MQIYYTRCKHCGQVYTYNTYGNDLMDNMEYEYTIEYYEDDRLKETLANIRIK